MQLGQAVPSVSDAISHISTTSWLSKKLQARCYRPLYSK